MTQVVNELSLFNYYWPKEVEYSSYCIYFNIHYTDALYGSNHTWQAFNLILSHTRLISGLDTRMKEFVVHRDGQISGRTLTTEALMGSGTYGFKTLYYTWQFGLASKAEQAWTCPQNSR